ncbi:hypothetical protein F1559_004096 [Cyanidiococcus yangmingshanensis]|uniref:Uncharacterized protein n=1 Tax=Cyanidiococcus yangmingshanensis TaxID=2690220 RepID=A0A7J7IN49_9RHOD|nr:hypothetical protein F1559_004096 [Cyanidiococcus yangmingshanensis]
MSLSVVAQQVRIETGGLNSSNSRLALDVSVSEEDISRTVVDTPSVTGHGLRHEPAGRYSDQATLAGQSLCPAEQHEENDFTNRSVVSASSGVEMISAQVGRPEQRLTTEDLKHILRDRCERCGAEHDRSFGSGRFCSVQCARRVAAKAKWARYHDRKRRAHSAEQIGVQAEGASTPPVYEPAHRKRIRPNGEMQCSLASWEMNGTRGLQVPAPGMSPNSADVGKSTSDSASKWFDFNWALSRGVLSAKRKTRALAMEISSWLPSHGTADCARLSTSGQ